MREKSLYLNDVFYFFLCNTFLFCIQLLFLYIKSKNFLQAIPLPLTVVSQIIATLAVHLCLYLLLSLVQGLLLLGIRKRQAPSFITEYWFIFIWLLSVCLIFSANAYYFPVSIFSKFLDLSPQIILLFIWLSLIPLSLLLVNSLFIYLVNPKYLGIIFLFFFTGVCLRYYFFIPIQEPPPNISADGHPRQSNIIILGIDSLSPESISSSSMPFLYRLINNSTQFTQAISPLARTYPAWTTILTGLYAKHHHAEENLVAKSRVKSKQSIVWLLNQLGYYTIYATDDRRFNAIDTDFGFAKIVGPKLGVNDLILGSFNDFPLNNLLINFPVSSFFSPYNYMNRASYFSYYPQTFNKELESAVTKRPRQKPLFLAVHFTLPHWPYAWAESSPHLLNNEFSLFKRNALYQSSLKKVDRQFQSFFHYLQKNHVLDNSLLILLSDHGEVLYYPNSRQTNRSNYRGKSPSALANYFATQTGTELNKSAGHGSDLLSPKQYHSFLAFNIYQRGRKITHQDKITTRVALIDISPTILNFLGIKAKNNTMDGISLLSSINEPKRPFPTRTFYLESGMYPNQNLSKEKVLAIGRLFYHVNSEDNELEIKDSALKLLDKQKLYAIINKNWILALYPDRDGHYIPVIQNLENGQWDDTLNGPFAKTTPAHKLYQKLIRFYPELTPHH